MRWLTLAIMLIYPFIAAALRAEQIDGSVSGIADLPDYCSSSGVVPFGRVEVEASGYPVVNASSNGTFTVVVSGGGPVKVTARLRSGGPFPFIVKRHAIVAEASATCVPGSPCDISFSALNSHFSERTTYYWAREAFEQLNDAGDCLGLETFPEITLHVEEAACQATMGLTSMTVGGEQFPCGDLGRIATVIAHELAHWIDCKAQDPDCPLPSPAVQTGGTEGMADGFGIFLVNASGYGSPQTTSFTGRGFHLNKCDSGLREHDALMRTPEDVLVYPDEYEWDAEILSGFYWDVSQSEAIPADTALDIWLRSICEEPPIETMEDAVQAYCRNTPVEFSSIVGQAAERHGFEPCVVEKSLARGDEHGGRVECGTGQSHREDEPQFRWSIRPGPVHPAVVLHVFVQSTGVIRVDIFDVNGRVVCPLYRGALDAGEQIVEWEGVDRAGRQAPAGVYFARVEQHGRVAVLKVVLLN